MSDRVSKHSSFSTKESLYFWDVFNLSRGGQPPTPTGSLQSKGRQIDKTQKKGEAERQSLLVYCLTSNTGVFFFFQPTFYQSQSGSQSFRKPAKFDHHTPPRMFLALSEFHNHTCAGLTYFSLLLFQRTSWQASMCALKFPGIQIKNLKETNLRKPPQKYCIFFSGLALLLFRSYRECWLRGFCVLWATQQEVRELSAIHLLWE